MVSVELDAMLREFAARRRVTSAASDVAALLVELETRFPRLEHKLRDETGRVRRHVRVFVNGRTIEALDGLATPLGADDRVDVLHSIQGG